MLGVLRNYSPWGFLRDLQENPPAKEGPGMCPGIPGEPEFPEFLDLPLQRALLRCQEDAEQADSARSRAETEVEQLQRLLAGMEKVIWDRDRGVWDQEPALG